MLVYRNIDGTIGMARAGSSNGVGGRRYIRVDVEMDARNANPSLLDALADPSPLPPQYHRVYKLTEHRRPHGERWFVYEEDVEFASPEQLQVRYEEVEAEWARLGGVMDALKARLDAVTSAGRRPPASRTTAPGTADENRG